jgi:pheromone alpha factor receptor
MTTVALLLPLSSLWAAKVTTSQSATFNLSSFVGSRSLSAASGDGSDTGHLTFGSQSTISGPLVPYRHESGSLGAVGSATMDSIVELRPRRVRDSTELDLEAMGVRVDKSYGVSMASTWLDN